MSVHQIAKFRFTCDGCKAETIVENIGQKPPDTWIETKRMVDSGYAQFPPRELREHWCQKCVKAELHIPADPIQVMAKKLAKGFKAP